MTARPFVMKEMVLSEDREAKKLAKDDSRSKLTQYLVSVVEELIVQANQEWSEMQCETDSEDEMEIPLRLLRLALNTRRPIVEISFAKILSTSPVDISARWRMSTMSYSFIEEGWRYSVLPEASILAPLSIVSVKMSGSFLLYLLSRSSCKTRLGMRSAVCG